MKISKKAYLYVLVDSDGNEVDSYICNETDNSLIFSGFDSNRNQNFQIEVRKAYHAHEEAVKRDMKVLSRTVDIETEI